VELEGEFMKVREVMTKTPVCCMSVDSLQTAADLMKSHDVGAIPVVNNYTERKLLGIITDRDICIKAVAARKLNGMIKVMDVMTTSPITCQPDDSIENCESKMERNQVRRIPVVDAQGVCIGIVAQADIALHDIPEHTSHTVAAISQHHAPAPATAHA